MSLTRSQIFFVLMAFAIIGGVWGWSGYHDLSGTYVNQDENTVRMLRLVETDVSKISGQFESVSVDVSGKVSDATAVVTGTTDGRNINLTFDISPLLPVPLTAFGTHGLNSLTLTFSVSGEPPKTLIYTTSDFDAFKLASDKLRSKSQRILAQQSAAEMQAKLEQEKDRVVSESNELVLKMEGFDAHIDVILQKLPEADASYHRITSKIGAYLKKVQSLPGQHYLVTRSQIIVAMNQGVVATDQVNIQVESIENDFKSNAEPLLQKLAQVEQSCPAQDSTFNKVCQKLQEAGGEFRTKCKTLSDALTQLDKTYQAELAAQQAMIERANQIQ